MPRIIPNLWFDTEGLSLLVDCADQDEVDRYPAPLTDGGEDLQCGWLKDRYGLSWQICPSDLGEVLDDLDRERAERAMRAMLAMVKIDIAAIRAVAVG